MKLTLRAGITECYYKGQVGRKKKKKNELMEQFGKECKWENCTQLPTQM